VRQGDGGSRSHTGSIVDAPESRKG
jgi:hypothetical protein